MTISCHKLVHCQLKYAFPVFGVQPQQIQCITAVSLSLTMRNTSTTVKFLPVSGRFSHFHITHTHTVKNLMLKIPILAPIQRSLSTWKYIHSLLYSFLWVKWFECCSSSKSSFFLRIENHAN